MTLFPHTLLSRSLLPRSLVTGVLIASAGSCLGACTTIGSLLSPYPEKFSCKNPDHGQCIHPDQAYADAVAERASHSDPAVTRDRQLLKSSERAAARKASEPRRRGEPSTTAFAGYRDSVYRELQGLIDAPVTPMLKAPRTVRTLVMPYADRQRPDRLYMPRYVYSILDAPGWVVGGYLVKPASQGSHVPVLGQVRERADDETAAPATVMGAPLP